MQAHQDSELQWEHHAIEAANYIQFYVSEVSERAMMVTGPYSESQYLSPLIQLIDEAILCYYRGYYTASFSTLLICLERYLRHIHSEQSPSQPATFRSLQKSVLKFPPSNYRDSAIRILKGLYSRYDVRSPTMFHFNRHRLLHGLGAKMSIDELNTCRTIQLFDILCAAENGAFRRYVDDPEKFQRRLSIYGKCRKYSAEVLLLDNTK
jgi:hypothetical protein